MSELTAGDINWGTSNGEEPTPTVEPQPPAPIDVATVLDDTEAFIRRYVVLNDDQATAVALWAGHTHAVSAADCTPYLHINSPTKRTGKTRLLEVLEAIVARPWFTGRTTAAALVRKIDAESPTLLLDESDATFKGPQEYAEALRGVLNSGYRRSGKASVCIGQGAGVHAHDFATFCPKAIAGIGKLPDTVADRSIPIALRRRTRHEPVSRWRERDGHREGRSIRAALAKWATTAVASLRDARPELPQTLSDRGQDVWEPLLGIADAAGRDWPQRARQAAVALMGEVDDDSVGIQLLADLRDIFSDTAVLSSADIVQKLTELADRPWATWTKGKPIAGHALARLLKPFGVAAGGPMRVEGVVVRAYRRAAFEDAWERYLPPPHEEEDADSVTF